MSLEPDNPRLVMMQGLNLLHTPPEYGGDVKQAEAVLRRSLPAVRQGARQQAVADLGTLRRARSGSARRWPSAATPPARAQSTRAALALAPDSARVKGMLRTSSRMLAVGGDARSAMEPARSNWCLNARSICRPSRRVALVAIDRRVDGRRAASTRRCCTRRSACRSWPAVRQRGLLLFAGAPDDPGRPRSSERLRSDRHGASDDQPPRTSRSACSPSRVWQAIARRAPSARGRAATSGRSSSRRAGCSSSCSRSRSTARRSASR